MVRDKFAAALLGAALAALGSGALAVQWDETYFPNVPLVTQTGEEVRFYDDLLRDKIVVVNFIYTECPDVCSLSTARMAQVVDWLGDRVGRDIFVYSISLDPETDTPERLADYARAFGAGEGWLFLTGERADIDLVRYKLGERSRSLNEHRSDMVIGNGATNEWRRASLMGSLRVATQEILQLDPDWRPAPAPAPVATESTGLPPGVYALSGTPGEAFFLKACAACHSIGAGDRVGPDLAGVTLRRDPDWLVRFLMAPDVLRAQGDPIATALDEKFTGVSMPSLGISKTDAADLIAYIQAQTDRLDTEAEAEITQAGHDHASHTH